MQNIPYFIASNSTALNRFLSVRSIPSNNKFNSFGAIIKTFDCTFGNLKTPRSNLLYHKQNPLRSQYNIFILSPRLLQNTNK